MKRLIISLGKIFLNFIYLFFKVFPTKKQIVYISMQSDNKSLDFKLLSEEIEKKDSTIKQVFLCKKMISGLEKTTDYISYVFNMISYTFKAMYYLATSTLCITESYCVPISILKHKKELKVIQIWHASGAVKKFGYQILDKGEGKASKIAKTMCMHKNYNYVIAPSEETKKVFSEAFNISQEKIIKLGLPRLEYISDPKYDRTEEFYKDYPNYRNKKIILYVPTFRKGKNIDLTEIKNYNLDKYKYRMIIRLHPLENASIPDECDINTKYSTYDLIKIADYIITDYSILSVEASLLNKPIFLYLYDLDDYNKNRGLNIDLRKELSTFTAKSFIDIMRKIENNDFNLNELLNYKNKYIEVKPEETTEKLSTFILSLMQNKNCKNIKKIIANKLENKFKSNVIIRKTARKIRYRLFSLKYNKIVKKEVIDNNKIIFASFNGRSYCDSPKAIYEYLIKNDKYKNYKFIWAFKDINKHNYLMQNKNTELVNIDSKEYIKKLGQAKYWFFNYTLPDYIVPKEKQIFTQCWHGTPLKRLGCDLDHLDNAMNSISETRDRYHTEAKKFNYFLSPSKFATEKFISIWDLKKINKDDCVLECGYPRNDFLYNYTTTDLEKIKQRLKLDGINKKIILYAPTYRDNQHSIEKGYTYKTNVDFDELQKKLSDEYIILFRAHWLVAQEFDFEKYKNFVIDVSNYDDINELYIISDILITDYSSVFFDFANLKRPIIFYMYDLEDYRDNIRGFYLELEELPGKIVKKEKELIEEIKFVNSKFEYDDKYKKFNKKFNYLDDGQSSKRVIEKIIF